MNKWYFAILGIVAVLVASVGMLGTSGKDNDVSMKAWQKVENAYLERLSILDPYLRIANRKSRNSVELVVLNESYNNAKSFTTYEFAKMSDRSEFRAKQETLTDSLAKLVVSQEIYPNLMADPIFKNLHSRLDEIENQISLSTAEYNRTVHEQELRNQSLALRIANILNPHSVSVFPVSQGKVKVANVMKQALKESAIEKESSKNLTVAAN